MTSQAAAAPAPRSSNPQFYRRPVAVNRERHAGKSLADAGYGFAAAANAVPLNAIEIVHAARNYPVVFSTTAPAMPLAVLGLREHQNLFVDAAGHWQQGVYIPAYVRRYPFIFAQAPGSTQVTLCIDEAAPHLVDGTARPLFEGGKPTPHIENALNFCMAFEAEREKTLAFARALDESGILVVNRADVTLAGGEKLQIGGYRVIDPAKLDALQDDTILDWRRQKWLAPVYAHLASAGCWQSLLALIGGRATPEAA